MRDIEIYIYIYIYMCVCVCVCVCVCLGYNLTEHKLSPVYLDSLLRTC